MAYKGAGTRLCFRIFPSTATALRCPQWSTSEYPPPCHSFLTHDI